MSDFLQDVGFFILLHLKIQRNKKLTDTDFKSLVFQDWVLKNSILGRLVIQDDIGFRLN